MQDLLEKRFANLENTMLAVLGQLSDHREQLDALKILAAAAARVDDFDEYLEKEVDAWKAGIADARANGDVSEKYIANVEKILQFATRDR